jgi:hypothetical protein
MVSSAQLSAQIRAQNKPHHSEPVSRTGSGETKGRARSIKFFNQAQPTFVVAQPGAKLTFVDDKDPEKRRVVRRNAREWVLKMKKEEEVEKDGVKGQTRAKSGKKKGVRVGALDVLGGENAAGVVVTVTRPRDVSAERFDPFDALPNVGRKVDHIVEYCMLLPHLSQIIVSILTVRQS